MELNKTLYYVVREDDVHGLIIFDSYEARKDAERSCTDDEQEILSVCPTKIEFAQNEEHQEKYTLVTISAIIDGTAIERSIRVNLNLKKIQSDNLDYWGEAFTRLFDIEKIANSARVDS